jgi:hypothetical protein
VEDVQKYEFKIPAAILQACEKGKGIQKKRLFLKILGW